MAPSCCASATDKSDSDILEDADIVEIKHIMLPPSPREFKDIYVVFELMETDLHQVDGGRRLQAARHDARAVWSARQVADRLASTT